MKWMLLLVCVVAVRAFGQSVDYWLHFPDEQRKSYAFLGYENDFFAATDRYYSQGLVACYKRPVRDSSAFRGFFLPMSKARRQIGFGLDHMAFTPSSISWDSIVEQDHPYAATLRANVLFETIDTAHEEMLSWSLSLGIMGPEAFGGELQSAFHRSLDNPPPNGWSHQLSTGLLLDAGFHGEHRVSNTDQRLFLVLEAAANAGTSRIDATFGTRFGIQLKSRNNFLRFHAYMNPAFRFVGYDATLQGSLIGFKSEYVIPDKDVTRVVFEREFGISLRYKGLTLSGVMQLHTTNYRQGMLHRWGAVRVGWYF